MEAQGLGGGVGHPSTPGSSLMAWQSGWSYRGQVTGSRGLEGWGGVDGSKLGPALHCALIS